MEEIEIPTEQLQDEIKEKAAELLERDNNKSSLYIAVSTALMAVFAAIAGLLAGHHSNEALIDQIKASDQWAFYQAKSIKAEIRNLSTSINATSQDSIAARRTEQTTISNKAKALEASSEQHLSRHVWFAGAVTLFQVAIALSAIAIIARKKILWVAGMILAMAGVALFITGFVL